MNNVATKVHLRVDLARELRGVASWVYVMEKKCAEPYGGDGVTHVPVGAELTADGRMKVGESYAPGPAVDRVLLATGYVYDFPFFEEEAVDMTFEGRRSPWPFGGGRASRVRACAVQRRLRVGTVSKAQIPRDAHCARLQGVNAKL